MVPLVNQFILGYGNSSVVSMVGPYLKKNGASEFDIGKTFFMAGVLSILGNVLSAKVRKHSYAFDFSKLDLILLSSSSYYFCWANYYFS